MVFCDGISGLWCRIGSSFRIIILWTFFSKKNFRESGKITVPDIMKEQYGQKVAMDNSS